MKKKNLLPSFSGHIFRATIFVDLDINLGFNEIKEGPRTFSQNPFTSEISKMRGLTKRFMLVTELYGVESQYVFARLYMGKRERKSITFKLDWLDTDDSLVQKAKIYNIALGL